jgi:hypothetical protein
MREIGKSLTQNKQKGYPFTNSPERYDRFINLQLVTPAADAGIGLSGKIMVAPTMREIGKSLMQNMQKGYPFTNSPKRYGRFIKFHLAKKVIHRTKN